MPMCLCSTYVKVFDPIVTEVPLFSAHQSFYFTVLYRADYAEVEPVDCQSQDHILKAFFQKLCQNGMNSRIETLEC